ncbi:MAG: hypothetical protein AW07_03478 [Candidatus Accumulibacter sp. SK-11]|nr:MAG: hypothetical protein AW07_03478 [Candidatus Accumulibacter sp. SK-11]
MILEDGVCELAGHRIKTAKELLRINQGEEIGDSRLGDFGSGEERQARYHCSGQRQRIELQQSPPSPPRCQFSKHTRGERRHERERLEPEQCPQRNR